MSLLEENNALVSVIIPTYNRSRWLLSAMDSVLAQTFRNFELIIVDDGSTDDTRDVVTQYRDQVKYFFQQNRGVASARNLGIKNAEGRLLTFLDSDDRWEKDKLEIQVKLMTDDPSVEICYTNEAWIRNGVRVNPKSYHRKYSGWIYRQNLARCFVSPSAVMINREVFERIGLFDESLTVCEDYDYWLRASREYPIVLIDAPLIQKYGGHDDQLSMKFWGMDQFRVKSLVKMLEQGSLTGEDRKATVAMLQKKCTILAQGFLKREKIEEAEFYSRLKEKYV